MIPDELIAELYKIALELKNSRERIKKLEEENSWSQLAIDRNENEMTQHREIIIFAEQKLSRLVASIHEVEIADMAMSRKPIRKTIIDRAGLEDGDVC